MHKQFACTTCCKEYPAIKEYFYTHQLKNIDSKTHIGECKECVKSRAKAYRDSLKEKNLSRKRNQKNLLIRRGKVYVIGIDDTHPYKIGITTGKIESRLAGLQTSHWLPLTVFYVSETLDNPNKLESEIHKMYQSDKIRGEWFNISSADIPTIKKLIEG